MQCQNPYIGLKLIGCQFEFKFNHCSVPLRSTAIPCYTQSHRHYSHSLVCVELHCQIILAQVRPMHLAATHSRWPRRYWVSPATANIDKNWPSAGIFHREKNNKRFTPSMVFFWRGIRICIFKPSGRATVAHLVFIWRTIIKIWYGPNPCSFLGPFQWEIKLSICGSTIVISDDAHGDSKHRRMEENLFTYYVHSILCMNALWCSWA